MVLSGNEKETTSGSSRPQQQQQQRAGKKRLADGKAIREEKRRRWSAKQEHESQKNKIEEEREAWIRQNSHYAASLSVKDLEKIEKNGSSFISGGGEGKFEVASILEPYMNVQGKASKKEAPPSDETRQEERYFLAEGTETVRLLIQQCVASAQSQRRFPPITLKSVFIKTSAFFDSPVSLIKDVEQVAKANAKSNKKDDVVLPKAAPPFHVLIGLEEVQSKVVGFPFCRGALACGVIPSWSEDEEWLMRFLKNHPRFTPQAGGSSNAQEEPQPQHKQIRILALDGVCDTANLGSIVRCASAFGLDAIILSQDCCDVWYRRAVRVSMGHCCRVPSFRVQSLSKTLRILKDELGITAYAAVIDLDSECILEKMGRGEVPGAWCCVMGNEGNGISRPVVEACSSRLRIDMADGVDSLSVPMATGILLHGLREREEGKEP